MVTLTIPSTDTRPQSPVSRPRMQSLSLLPSVQPPANTGACTVPQAILAFFLRFYVFVLYKRHRKCDKKRTSVHNFGGQCEPRCTGHTLAPTWHAPCMHQLLGGGVWALQQNGAGSHGKQRP